MKEAHQLYALTTTECPECAGEGRLETMTALSYDGAQTWKVEVCPHCGGDGVSFEPIKCPFCDDAILKSELAENEWGTACHASCLEESRPTQDAQDVSYRRCPACGSLLEERSVYCDNCGTDTPRL
jgi:hypothetical protein